MMFHDKDDNLLASILGFFGGMVGILWQNIENIVLAMVIAGVSALTGVIVKDVYAWVKSKLFK